MRVSNELFVWGLSKFFDLYLNGENVGFVVVVCIDTHDTLCIELSIAEYCYLCISKCETIKMEIRQSPRE